jgi:magnesium transporter
VAVDLPAAESWRAPGTAGEEAVSDVPRASSAARVGEVRAALSGRRFASATEVAVVEGERLVGVVGIERLFAAPDGAPVGELADAPEVVSPEMDLEVATRAAARSGGRSVAVVDAEGRFHGLVPAGRLLCVLELEHEEDLARLGGFLSSASAARMASEEVVLRRLWHRLPWLDGLRALGRGVRGRPA